MDKQTEQLTRSQIEEQYAGLENRFFENPELSLRAAFSPDTFNEEARTVEITFATEKPVRRNTWEGPVDEILSFDAGAVRLERFNSGANVLDNHDRWTSVSDVVGVIERAWVQDRKGYALIRFARTDEADKIMGMVKDGILRNSSVGYAVYAYQKTENDNGPDVWRAIDWEPVELSFVSVPADYTAQVRHQGGNNSIYSQDNKRSMDDQTTGTTETPVTPPATPTPVTPTETPQPAQVTEAERAAIALAERSRVAAILRNVETAGLERSVADEFINAGHSTERAAAEILTRMGQKTPPATSHVPDVQLRGDGEIEKRRQGATAALFIRSGGDEKHLSEQARTFAREFRGVGLRDMARVCLDDAGVNTRNLSGLELVSRAFTQSTSDFPIILEGLLRQTLLAEYENLADSWSKWCYRGSVSDFREWKRKRQGALANLPVVPENAEYTTAAIPDAESNGIYVETYGQKVNVTRQMIINDDLDAFTRLPAQLARAAARTVEAKAYAVLIANPTMADGYALFSTEHANLVASGSGGVITIDRVDIMRQLIAKQKDPAGKDYLNLRPSVLLTSLAQGGTARTVNDAQFDVDVSNKFQVPNKVRGLFQSVIDTPQLTGNGWYMFASPMDEPVIEVAFLDGVSAPFLEMKDGWNVDGAEWKVRLDFGVAAVGYRGAAFNFGS